MISVIGIGTAGINIASCFEKYPQYDVYKIGEVEENSKNEYRWIPPLPIPEKAEESTPDLRKFFIDVNEDVYIFLEGSGLSVNAALGILEQIKEKNLHVFYLKPDTDLLTSIQRMQNNAVYHIMQEYARSGLFGSFNIINNFEYDKILGQIPIVEYWSKVNESIVSALHMMNVFQFSKPTIGKINDIPDISRITTYGIVSMENFEESLFYPLDNVRQKRYYFGISKERLKTDNDLYSKIVESMREKTEDGDIDVSYGIYATNYEHDIAYCEHFTHVLQEI